MLRRLCDHVQGRVGTSLASRHNPAQRGIIRPSDSNSAPAKLLNIRLLREAGTPPATDLPARISSAALTRRYRASNGPYVEIGAAELAYDVLRSDEMTNRYRQPVLPLINRRVSR